MPKVYRSTGTTSSGHSRHLPRSRPDSASVRKTLAPSFLVTLLVISVVAPLVFVHAIGESWLTGWTYRKSHVINYAAGAGTNYQVKITAHYGSGTDSGSDVYLNSHSKTDFSDIRFTASDGSTLLDYWLESKTDSDNAVFWVEVSADLSTTAQTIYIYYGNSTVTTTSNGGDTFLFFDDFPGSSVDTSKWTTGGTPTVSGSELTINAAGEYVKSISTFTYVAYKAKAKVTTYANYGYLGLSTHVADGGCQPSEIYETWVTPKVLTYSGTASNYESTNIGTQGTSYNIWEILWKSGQAKFYVNGTLKDTDTTYVSSSALNVVFDDYSGAPVIVVDWVLIRKYVDPEPAHSTWGSENTATTNDGLTLDLTGASYKGTKTLLAGKQDYNFTLKVSDANGVANLNYAEIRLDPTGKNVILRWTESTGAFSEQSDPSNYVALNTGTSSHYTSGNQKVLKFYVTINWNWGDSAETITVQAYVIDDASASDTDNYTNVFGVENDLTSASLAVDDYRVNPSQTLTFSGYWYYEGTTIYPPDGDYQVKVKLNGVQKGSTDTTLVSGAFSISDVTAESTVASYSYTVEATYMASAGSFSAVVVDRLTINYKAVDNNRRDINTQGQVRFKLRSEYDGAFVQAGTVSVNGTSATWDSGNGWWYYSYTLNAVGLRNFVVTAVSWSTYDITALNSGVSTNSTSIIWDRVNINSFSVSDNRVNVGDTASFSVSGIYEYDSVAWSGTYSLNDSTTKSTVGRYGFKVQSITDTNYGLTAFQQTAPDLYVIWDRVVVSVKGNNVTTSVHPGEWVKVYFKLRSEYDSAFVQSGSVSINGTSATWDATNSRWYRDIPVNWWNVAKVYVVTAVSWDTYGITALNSGVATNSTGFTSTGWVAVTLSFSRTRIDVGANALTYLTVGKVYGWNGAPCSLTEYGLNDTTTKSSVGKWWFKMASLTETTYGITNFTTNEVSMIWDRLILNYKGSNVTTSAHPGETVRVYFKLRSEYDSAFVQAGSVEVNGSATTWSAGSGYWYLDVSVTWWNVSKSYIVTGVSWDSYLITALNSGVATNSTSFTSTGWIILTLTATDTRIDVGSNATLTWTGKYGWNNQPFSSLSAFTLNDTTTKATVGKYGYKFATVTSPSWGITNFTTTSCFVIFDRVDFLLTASNQHVAFLGSSAPITYPKKCYAFDSFAFTGTVTLNDSLVKNTVGTYGYKVQSIVDPTYGLTAFTTNSTWVAFVAPEVIGGGSPVQKQEIPLVISALDKNRYPLQGIDIEIIEQPATIPTYAGKTDEFGHFKARIYTNTFYTVHATNTVTGELQVQEVFISKPESATVSFEFGVEVVDWTKLTAVLQVLIILVLAWLVLRWKR